MSDLPQRSLYSVIPARVRDDRELTPSAKLLYGELSALAVAEGYCWATNQYFADLLGLSLRTVTRLISQLSERGHIQVEVERDAKTNAVEGRKIWIAGPPGSVVPPPDKNVRRSRQKCQDPPDKNGQKNNIYNNTIPPLTPPQGGGDQPKKTGKRKTKYDLADDAKPVLRAYVGDDQELASLLAEFVDLRAQLRAINSRAAVTTLLRELDRLSEGRREDKLELIRQSLANSWKSVFPLRGLRALPAMPEEVPQFGTR